MTLLVRLAINICFLSESKGKHKFKNINEEIELAELAGECENAFVVDPVCRMLILNKEMATKHPESADIFLCSPACLDIYQSKAGFI